MNVNLLDCTLRDGTYLFSPSYQEKLDILEQLILAGIKYIEIGHKVSYGIDKKADKELVDLVKKAKEAQNIKVGTIIIPTLLKPNIIENAFRIGLDFIRIGEHVNDINKVFESVEKAKKLDIPKIFIQLIKISEANEASLICNLKALNNLGVDCVYIVDSNGCLVPRDIIRLYNLVREHTDSMVGFHAHNNNNLALVNSYVFSQIGGDLVDGTLGGIGRDAGNTVIENIAYLLSATYQLGQVNYTKLAEVAFHYCSRYSVSSRNESHSLYMSSICGNGD